MSDFYTFAAGSPFLTFFLFVVVFAGTAEVAKGIGQLSWVKNITVNKGEGDE